jgi:hypothetical protein
MSDPSGGTQQPPLENDEYAPDETDLPPANRLLRPRRSFVAPVVTLIVAFGLAASLTAIGISRLGPIDQMRPTLGSETPLSPQPDRLSEQPVEPPEPFKSLVLDAARSYLGSTNTNAQTENKLRGCLMIEDGSKERLDCYDGIVPPDPKPEPPVAKVVNDCKFLKEEDERLGCFNRYLVQPAPPKASRKVVPKAQPSL